MQIRDEGHELVRGVVQTQIGRLPFRVTLLEERYVKKPEQKTSLT